MEEAYFKKITTAIILGVLVVLSFFLLKKLLLSIIMGIILAFIFSPIYDFLYKRIKSKDVCAMIICCLLLIIIILPLWYLTPVMVNQSIKIYISSQQIDFITPLKNFFPSLFTSETFSNEIGSALHSFVTKTTNAMMNSFSKLILNFPTLFLQMLVALFTFYFVMRDKEALVSYIESLSPFSKDVEKRLFNSSKEITVSVLYGQIILGIVQGIVAGIGYFLFGVPNALLLTLLTCFAGIFPIIGTSVVWVPIVIYLMIAGEPISALGVTVFGIASFIIENFIKPIYISKRTHLNSSIILIGMVGGIFMFGILGIILGPLILSYLIIVLEIYRNKKVPGIIQKGET